MKEPYSWEGATSSLTPSHNGHVRETEPPQKWEGKSTQGDAWCNDRGTLRPGYASTLGLVLSSENANEMGAPRRSNSSEGHVHHVDSRQTWWGTPLSETQRTQGRIPDGTRETPYPPTWKWTGVGRKEGPQGARPR
jgi:hypothetical protein